ncbi:23S rRNA (guanosine-2'-O-)-methyltransferase RlmB [Gammaproteobacteria bacterium]
MTDLPIFGFNSLLAALHQGRDFRVLWIDRQRDDGRIRDLLEILAQRGCPVKRVVRGELDRAAQGGHHQGVLGWPTTRPTRPADLDEILTRLTVDPFLLVLDQVQDPHNLGACLRTAAAVGVHAVVVPKDGAVGITPTVIKVASGAVEWVPLIVVTNLARTLRSLKERGIWLVGSSADGTETLFDIDLGGPLALVLGNEGDGLRRLTRETCDRLIRIPMVGPIESLNVSVAAGVCLYQAFRCRQHPVNKELKKRAMADG